MSTIGVLLRDTQASQLNWIVLKELNNLNRENNKNYVAYYLNPTPICVNSFCSLNTIHDIHKCREGILIATNFDTALILSKSLSTARKVFYIWDLEFIHNKNSNYLYNLSIMKNLDLWTRSKSYADAIENYCGIRPKISESIRGIINGY